MIPTSSSSSCGAGRPFGGSVGRASLDGFTGGDFPPKASIREVRINSNPFSPEYDRPGLDVVDLHETGYRSARTGVLPVQ